MSGADVIPISGASGVGTDWALDRLIEAIPAAETSVDDTKGDWGAEDAVEWSPV